MKHIAYIPTRSLDIPRGLPTSIYGGSELLVKIEQIITDVNNGGVRDPKKISFASKAMELLGADEDGYISSYVFSDKHAELIRLYMSLKIYKGNSPDTQLRKEWANAMNDQNSTVAITRESLYCVYQNIHGDVVLSRKEIPSAQGELFPKTWEDVVDKPITAIQAHQETTSLVTALLLAYARSGIVDIRKLSESMTLLEGKSPRGCFAAESGTKDDELYFAKRYFEAETLNSNLNISIYSGHGNSYGTEYSSINKSIIFFIYETDTKLKETVLEIPTVDIPDILPMLCVFSGRSGNTGKLLIEWFIDKYSK